MKILDGKKVASLVLEELRSNILTISEGITKPKLSVILVGDNHSSKIYVKIKEAKCRFVGADFELYHLSEDTKEIQIITLIKKLNEDSTVTGILVQLPLPKEIDPNKVISSISKNKDVDGLHPEHLVSLMEGEEEICPCTPLGIIKLLEYYDINIKGKNACVIGYSNIVGKPMVGMLRNRGARVEVCRSKTKDIPLKTKKADILVSATGVVNRVIESMVKPGAVVIDVGMIRLSDGSLRGDVDFNRVKKVASYISPAPGGVGPMTVAMVVYNLVELYKKQHIIGSKS